MNLDFRDYLLDCGATINTYNYRTKLLDRNPSTEVSIRGLNGRSISKFVGHHEHFGTGRILGKDYDGPNLISLGFVESQFLVLKFESAFVLCHKRGGKCFVAFKQDNLFPLEELTDENRVRLWENTKHPCGDDDIELSKDFLCFLNSAQQKYHVVMLHELLGHPGNQYLLRAIENGEYSALDIPIEVAREALKDPCPGCMVGKMKAGGRIKSKDSNKDPAKIGEHIHADIMFVKWKSTESLKYFVELMKQLVTSLPKGLRINHQLPF
jgi:hypothetical protein